MEKQLLSERLLKSEFTFGFELEAIVSTGSSLFDDTYEVFANTDDYDDDDFKNELREQIQGYLDNFLDGWKSHKYNKHIDGKSNVHGDSSIVIGEDDDDNDFTFEYSSPVLEAIPDNFNRVIKLLDGLKRKGIYTNESCGFHHHIRFGNMNYKDLVWVYVNLACDDEALTELTSMKDYSFVNDEYASQKEIDALAKAIFNKEWETASKYITDSKYRVFRLHPQGTIEWRGPRGFLNKGKLDEIKQFYRLFDYLIRKVITYVDSKVIAGTSVTKEEFFENIGKYIPILNSSSNSDKKIQDESIEKFLRKIKLNPFLILKIMKNEKLSSLLLKIFKTRNLSGTARDMLFDIHANKEKGFYKDNELIEIIRFLYKIFSECFDKHVVFDIFGLYNDLKYVYSQKTADEMLENADSMFGYRSCASTLHRNGFEIKEPAQHFIKYLKKYGNTNNWQSILTWMSYEKEDTWGLQMEYMSGEEYGKLAVTIYNMILKDELYTDNQHYVWSNLVRLGNAISKKLNGTPYKKEFVKLLNKLKFSEDKYIN